MNNLEKAYYDAVSESHIKEYGQFYTSKIAANFMIKWLIKDGVTDIYDPAFGMGAFYDAGIHLSNKIKFTANEVDKCSYDFYLRNSTSNLSNLVLRNVDYFSIWNEKEKYNAIVCNPPYLKFQNVKNRNLIFKKLSDSVGSKVSGYTNMASAFLLKAVHDLANNGKLAFIMPLEFLNAGYGSIVKEYLLNNGTIENIIQIKDEKGVFKSVVTTVCIVLFVKGKKGSCVTFSKIDDVNNFIPLNCNQINLTNINLKNKWQHYFDGEASFSHIGFVPLSQYGKFKRGIATGANEFFALNLSDTRKYKFLESEFRFCITKSSQIKKSILDDEDLLALANSDEKIFVFSVNKENVSKEAMTYIAYGESQGFNQRYLTKNRKCWFELEKREIPEILFGVFSRNKYKIIRNKTKAISLTCYHGFTLNADIDKKIIDRIFIYLKSDLATKSISNNKRIYGSDLIKFEPNDLSNVLVPSLEQLRLMSDSFVSKQMKNIELYDCLDKKGNDFINNL